MAQEDFKALIEEGLINKHKVREDKSKTKVQKNRVDKRRYRISAMGKAKRRVQVTNDSSKIMASGSGAGYSGKTGTPEWFKKIQQEGEVRRALRRTSTKKLADLIGGPSAYALHDAGFRNLWTLSQADLNDLLRLDSLRPGALKDIRRALLSYGVTVKWQTV